MSTLITGFLFVLAIIPGIGPQNLNILSHGIKRSNHYLVGTTCIIGDGVFLILGGLALKLFNSEPIILTINIIGILFLIGYILQKIFGLFKVYRKIYISVASESKKTAVARALFLTWLNPLVFIDMVVVVGGASSHYFGNEWLWFMCGTLLGDIVWIYGLTFVASNLSFKLNTPKVWLLLDVFTVVVILFVLYKTIVLVVK